MDSLNPNCCVCGQALSDTEVRLLAEAEEITEETLRKYPEDYEILCDACAEG